jgi:hypothetical protein
LDIQHPLYGRPTNYINRAEVVHMKRILMIGIAVAVVSLTGTAVVSGQTAPNRPQGVSATQWIPISDRLGFVVLPSASIGAAAGSADPDVLLVKPPVEGYFMVKDKGGWSRVAIAEPVFGPGGT